MLIWNQVAFHNKAAAFFQNTPASDQQQNFYVPLKTINIVLQQDRQLWVFDLC